MPYFFRKLGKMLQNLSSAAVVIDALRVKYILGICLFSKNNRGAQWLSGRVLDSRPRGRELEPHRRHCVVSLSKNINPSFNSSELSIMTVKYLLEVQNTNNSEFRCY